jgi:hypothetical protein
LLSEDIGSALKGGVKVCQRQLVNEALVSLVTEYALNLGREAATPIQGAFNASFLGRVQALKLMRHNLSVEAVNSCVTKSGSCRVPSFHDTLPIVRRTPAERSKSCFARVRRAIKKD